MPMNPNQVMETVQKADAALSELVSSGGYISERELPTFVRQSILMAELSAKVRRVMMESKQLEIPRLRFPQDGSFILYPIQENEGHPLAERSKPTFGALNLNAVGLGGHVNVSKDILLSNVEKESLVQTLRDIIYPQIGADMERIAIQGDTTSGTPSLAVLDGWLKLATAHVVAGGGNRLSSTLLASTYKAMPQEYDMGGNIYMTSRVAREDYLDELKARATGLGDRATGERFDPAYRGEAVMKFPLWPAAQGGGDRTTVLYADPKNLVLGIFNQVSLGVYYDAPSRQTQVIFDVWMDAGFEVSDAVVATTNILNS